MKRVTYKKAGVDIDKANKLVETIKPHVASTKRQGWVGNIGAFAGFFRPDLKKYKDPLFVGSTDGVGTKLLIAQKLGRHYEVGIDLVAMSVNDVVTCGAEPLFFLDYFGTGKLKPAVMEEVIKGIADGCKQSNCMLIGGETAELPGMYGEDIYDLAGFCAGIVDRKDVIDGKKVKEGDLILGIQSSGVHSNGYSMVRKVFSDKELKGRIGDMLMKPTILYVKPVLELMKHIEIKGIAHITGGGFFDNIVRALPDKNAAVIFKKSWQVPEIFGHIQQKGKIKDTDMFWTFNMGIGMVIVVPKQSAWKAKQILLNKFKLDSWIIGEVIKGKRRVELIEA